MTEQRLDQCSHGLPMKRADGAPEYCPHCELLWHEPALKQAEAAVARHRRKIADAVAVISRTCGDA